MDTDNVLRWMRHWIWMEKDKYEKALYERIPGVEPFVLTSLAFSASKTSSFEDSQSALARLHRVAKQHLFVTYDVVTPMEAIERIQLALRCQHCGIEHRPAQLDAPYAIEGRAVCAEAYFEIVGRPSGQHLPA
jgi:hypothetical protein